MNAGTGALERDVPVRTFFYTGDVREETVMEQLDRIMKYLCRMNGECIEDLGLAMWYLEGWETCFYLAGDIRRKIVV
jgi:hypothetical protein